MKKAFLIAGVALTISLVLMMAVNYVVYSQRLVESSVQQRVMIDHMSNRATDVNRIIQDVVNDVRIESGSPPGQNLVNLNNKMSVIMPQINSSLKSEGITFNYDLKTTANELTLNMNFSSGEMFKSVNIVQDLKT